MYAEWWATYLCLVNACSHSSANIVSLSFFSSLSDFQGNSGIFKKQLRCEQASSQGGWHRLTLVSHPLFVAQALLSTAAEAADSQAYTHRPPSFLLLLPYLFSLSLKYVIFVWGICLRLTMLCDHRVQHHPRAGSETSAFNLNSTQEVKSLFPSVRQAPGCLISLWRTCLHRSV